MVDFVELRIFQAGLRKLVVILGDDRGNSDILIIVVRQMLAFFQDSVAGNQRRKNGNPNTS